MGMNITEIVNKADPEHRIALLTAWNQSDGTMHDFQQQLESLCWDYPDLDVEQIMLNIT
jgi:hypothetical protein